MARSLLLIVAAGVLSLVAATDADAAQVPENACALLSVDEIRSATGFAPRFIMPLQTCVGVDDPSTMITLQVGTPDAAEAKEEEADLADYRGRGAAVVVQRDGPVACRQILYEKRAADYFMTMCEAPGKGMFVRMRFVVPKKELAVPIEKVKGLVTLMARRAGVL